VVFTQGMTIHPCNPALLYVAVDLDGSSTDPNCAGVFHSEDGGATWRELGAFDSPVNVRVDPEDPLHLYVCDGVRGGTNGFWVSHDGGATWAMPDGFKQASQAVGSSDVYHVEPDPTDFNHVLLTFHSPWHGGGASGVLESFDGGTTFKIHEGLEDWAWAYGYDVFFLYEPQLGIGDPRTWLFGTQGKGYWRTTDAGEHWTKVSNENMRHGGGTVYYTRDGVLYVSGDASILRSTDNGVTFTSSVPAQFSAYLSVIGDGKNLWTGNHGGGPFLTAPESAPDSWKPFNDQQFKEGPFQMAHDKQHQILYSANASGGVWALKLQ